MASDSKKRKNQDGDLAADLYSRIPCTVGYQYARIGVDGRVKSCCVAKHQTGDLNKSTWSEFWHGTEVHRFREKTGQIHKEQFHKTDREWGFCNQCSHISINFEAARVLGQLPGKKES